jgi:hypothetical protein
MRTSPGHSMGVIDWCGFLCCGRIGHSGQLPFVYRSRYKEGMIQKSFRVMQNMKHQSF